MLAFTLDLTNGLNIFRYVAIACLFAFCLTNLGFGFLKKLYKFFNHSTFGGLTANNDFEYKRKNTDRSSDQPPPNGFVEHLEIIESVSPNASAEERWNYAKAGMTEAEVAIAEAKLARKSGSADVLNLKKVKP